MHLRKKDIIDWIVLMTATIAAFACISAKRCATELSVKAYTVEADIAQPMRIVQLSDLHGHSFGENNKELVELVIRQDPDFIVMTGDMMDKRDDDADTACELIRSLQTVAPIYYCHGNHEMDWEARTGLDLNPVLAEAGAIVLDADYVDITVNGQELRIGGFHGYYRYWGMLPSTGREAAFADAFEDTERYKILLCHIPTGWIDWGKINGFPVDLVLTGHYHGGQIRIPFIGGIYAPYIGLFPKYTEGMFVGETATCILSTGLGSSPGIPRINNLPQVVVVDMVPKQ